MALWKEASLIKWHQQGQVLPWLPSRRCFCHRKTSHRNGRCLHLRVTGVWKTRRWSKPGQVKPACEKPQLCHSQGTNTAKVQPKGTKAAQHQGCRLEYFPKRGCEWIWWDKIFTGTMNNLVWNQEHLLSAQEKHYKHPVEVFFSSLFFLNRLKFYKVLIENP